MDHMLFSEIPLKTIAVTLMGSLTVHLEDELEEELTRLARQTQSSKSELALDILRRRIAIEKFRALRAQLIRYAEAAGYITDDEVFREIS